MPVTGQWNVGGIAIPDFGLSEKLGIGAPNPLVSAQNSGVTSGLVNNSGQALQTPNTSGGGVNLAPLQQQQYYGPTQNPSSPTPTGTNNGVQNPNTTPSGPSPEQQLIDQAYGARIGDINQQQSTLQGNQQSILGDIGNQYDTSKNSLGSNLQQSNAQLDLSTQQGQQRQQDALIAARRLYNDLIQGGQQRFGGASSAGEAYQALTGRQLQQNQQQTSNDYNQFMSQVSFAKQNVQAKYTDALAQLESQKNQAISQANRDFQDKMSQLNSLKSQAAGDKANQQLQALQNLRNQIYNINISTAQNSQALSQYKTQAEQQLQEAISAFGQNAGAAQTGFNAFSENTTTNPQNALSFGGQSAQANPMMMGAISPTQRKDQFGNPIA